MQLKTLRGLQIKNKTEKILIKMAPIKILVCGSVDGHFSKFFKRIASINKKNGPFEMVLCVGNFFSANPQCVENWKQFLLSKTKVEIPVYILGPTLKQHEVFYSKEKLKDGEELFENILYLGKKGVFTTASGLTLAYLSGIEQSNNSLQADVSSLNDQLIRDDKFIGVDILITSSWPQGVNKYTKSSLSSGNESPSISFLASSLKPRYHFSSHIEKFFERQPYRNHKVLRGSLQHVSRFIALAPSFNDTNEKSIYAFSIEPLSCISRDELIKQPPDTTEFPYDDIKLSTIENQKKEQFFFREDNKRKGDQKSQEQHKVPKGPPTLTSDCWFCLGSKDVEKHLVVSVGESTYMAVAKGAINDDHLLILPISHHNSTVVLPGDVRLELEKYKEGLRKMFNAEQKSLISFERNFYTQHLQLQVIGIPLDLCSEVKDTFLDLGQSVGMDFIEIPKEKDLSEMVAVTTPYFLVELSTGERLLHKVKGRMPLQFGREALTSPSLLNLPDRVDWKQCKLSVEEESKCANNLRKRFQPYDFNFD
ncbi:CWF19-like protein 1 isoform X1 [Hydra vulgaris]|uniref:CWF19-like protein 1 isoform X1 n=2 Tax=Hydra vulgaris TaxID=6087 RepID=UPI001F5EE83D|nr:CWF19-like protein 1 isoform X1 [Hydra vulgaris]